MGLRFRKSINLGKGMRVNLSKSGIGWSVGGKGFRYTKRADGKTQTTASIPNTGISYVKVYGDKNKSGNNDNFNNNLNNNFNRGFNGLDLLMWILIILFPIIGFPMFLTRKKFKNNPKNIATAVIIGLYLTFIRIPLFIGNFSSPGNNINSATSNSNIASQAETKIEDEKVQEEVSEQSENNTEIAEENKEESNVTSEENVVVETPTEPIQEETVSTEEVIAPTVEETQEVVAPPVSAPIQNETKVYISKSGKKYHRNPNCGNMKSAKEVNLSDVQDSYEPCSKCN